MENTITVNRIILQNEEGTKQIEIRLDSKGHLKFEGDVDQRAFFPGDIKSFNSLEVVGTEAK